MRRFLTLLSMLAVVALAGGCSGDADDASSANSCGPTRGTVERVIDGDTIELSDGLRVRYLLVDTPERTRETECWGAEATQANRELVEGKEVTLAYDAQCTDRFGRLLAYVRVGGREVNQVLVERGHACVLYIPPNGEDRVDELRDVEERARDSARGLWGACSQTPC